MDPLSSFSATSLPLPPRNNQSAAQQSAKRLGDVAPATGDSESGELKEAFGEFVGQTLFGSMLSSMRKTVGKPAYMHGGKMEETFQQQLDQYIVEDLSEASANTIADPMFELFNMQRK